MYLRTTLFSNIKWKIIYSRNYQSLLCRDTGSSWWFQISGLEERGNFFPIAKVTSRVEASSCDVRFIQKSRNVVLLQGITRVCTRTRHSRGMTYPSENRVSIQKPKTISLRRSSVSSRARRAPGIVKNRVSFRRCDSSYRFDSQIVFVGCGASYRFTLIFREWAVRLSLNPLGFGGGR